MECPCKHAEKQTKLYLWNIPKNRRVYPKKMVDEVVSRIVPLQTAISGDLLGVGQQIYFERGSSTSKSMLENNTRISSTVPDYRTLHTEHGLDSSSESSSIVPNVVACTENTQRPLNAS